MKVPALRLAAFLRARSGATAIEYAMIGSLVSIAIVVGATAVGINLKTLFFAKVAAGLS